MFAFLLLLLFLCSVSLQAKRAARRSAYTRAIQKPSNLVDKSEEQQNYYRQMILAEVLDTELEFNDHIK